MKIVTKHITSEGFADRPMFHPKAAMYPDGRICMALQTIGGGDYYGPVEYCFSDDKGQTWSKPEKVPTLDWMVEPRHAGAFQGVCDTVVSYDPATGCMLFIGHNVFYKNDRFMDTLGSWDKEDYAPELLRRGCGAALRPDGTWTERQLFEPAEFAGNFTFMCGCAQRILEEDGSWLIPFNTRTMDNPCCYVTVFRVRFDGEKFEFGERGNILRHEVNRGLLEPSLMKFKGTYYMTLRAEDGCAYWTRSADGLNYDPIQPWKFDDNTLLETSTTQQHFLCSDEKLYLSYVRKNEVNQDICRFRAPLYIAEVNPETMELIKATEEIVFPIDGDLSNPDEVFFSGNFMPMRINDHEWLITDGQSQARAHCDSKVKIAYITL